MTSNVISTFKDGTQTKRPAAVRLLCQTIAKKNILEFQIAHTITGVLECTYLDTLDYKCYFTNVLRMCFPNSNL